jgi:acyl dehydratase
MEGIETTMAGLAELAGTELGATQWREMTQGEVDLFADATDDHQFIHVDPERARDTPFGGTIAHGFLTLSLVAPIQQRLLRVTDAGMAVNYGLDRVRFPAPLRVGSQWRGTSTITEVRPIEGGVQVHVTTTVEVLDQPKPAMVADGLLRFYA